jgi:hypothetical protein
MIELMMGMILVLILLAGAVQFMDVADAHTGIDSGVRGRTGFLAMSPRTLEDAPRYIETWQPGADGQRFTADDRATCGSPDVIGTIANGSVNAATDWDAFSRLTRPSSLEALHQSPVPLMALGFIGIRQTTTVPVSQLAQDLFYGNASVTVQEDCWLPIMNGLY